MARRSRFPDAADIRQVVTAEQVAAAAGTPVDVARAVVDAHLFAIDAVAASGVVGVTICGVLGPPDSAVRRRVDRDLDELLALLDDDTRLADVVDRTKPSGEQSPRHQPIFEDELVELTSALAAARRPEIAPGETLTVLDAWWGLCEVAIADGAINHDVVVRSSWDALERDLEDWLEAHLDALFGVPLELVQRQWCTPHGGIADLVARVPEGHADLLTGVELIVVENKAGDATAAAVDQVLGYATAAEEALGGPAVAMVAATGFGDGAEKAADDHDVITRTWGDLGFLDRLWDPDGAAEPIRAFLDAIRYPT